MRQIMFIVDEYQYQQIRSVCNRRKTSLRSLVLRMVNDMDYEDRKSDRRKAAGKGKK